MLLALTVFPEVQLQEMGQSPSHELKISHSFTICFTNEPIHENKQKPEGQYFSRIMTKETLRLDQILTVFGVEDFPLKIQISSDTFKVLSDGIGSKPFMMGWVAKWSH